MLVANCAILDFGGNILRHGPVDALQVTDKTPGSGSGGTSGGPAKECPQCNTVVHAGYSVCPECGHEFPPPSSQQHEAQADDHGVLSGQITDNEYDVKDVYFSIHTKRGADEHAPKTMRVDYQVEFNEHHSEWVCPEHPRNGYARGKFETWWRARSNEPLPDTAEGAVAIAQEGGLAETQRITVRNVAGERFDRIIHYELGSIPPRFDGSDEREDDQLPVMVGAENDVNIDESDLPF